MAQCLRWPPFDPGGKGSNPSPSRVITMTQTMVSTGGLPGAGTIGSVWRVGTGLEEQCSY